MKKFISFTFLLLACAGCSMGSGVSGIAGTAYYAYTSREASSLTKEAEDRILLNVLTKLDEREKTENVAESKAISQADVKALSPE